MMRRLLLACLLTLSVGGALAHPIAPALLDLTQTDAEHWQVLWRYSTRIDRRDFLEPRLPGSCVELQAPTHDYSVAGLGSSYWQLRCPENLAGERIEIGGLQSSPVNVLLRINPLAGEPHYTLLDARRVIYVFPDPSATGAVQASAGPWQALPEYLIIGMEHLALGADHLLFLIALLLLVRGWRRILLTLTAFTLGHSLTLTLATLDLVQVNPMAAELLIALTLLIAARELLRDKPSVFGRHAGMMAAGFGLIHGLGFAGALGEIGLPEDALLPALLGFNLGIELAQIGIAVVLLALLRPFIRPTGHGSARPWLVTLPAYAIGVLSVHWCLERGLALSEGLPVLPGI